MPSSNLVRELIENTGKFDVHEEFTEGMNGYSFRASHKYLEHPIFLKILDLDQETQNTFAEPKALMDAMAQGKCENLVQLYDTEYLGDEHVLMSMEFIEGGSLLNEIKQESLGQMDAVQIALGVINGVNHLHNARFLHRDIKPGNILLNKSSAKWIPKLGDFGSVRRLPDDQSETTASKHSGLYRPPEAWGDTGWFSFPSDLYQVGICLYEMVNGPLPYSFESQLDWTAQQELKAKGCKSILDLDPFDRSKMVDDCLERRVKSGKLLAMRNPRPCYSARLNKIVRKATSVDTALRYQNAFEFHNALQSLSVPNWKVVTGGFEALGWRGADWMVEHNITEDKWCILRRKSGPKYRLHKTCPESKIAFRAVEDLS